MSKTQTKNTTKTTSRILPIEALPRRNGAEAGAIIQISAPDFQEVEYTIQGTAPYMQNRWTEKAIKAMRDKQLAGSASAEKKKGHAARDFDEDYQQSFHRTPESWAGIPAEAFRKAMISACRLVGFKMTIAKLSFQVLADGYDRVDGFPLIRIYGEPEKTEMIVPNANGAPDFRVRPMWREWTATLRLKYDVTVFSLQDITNLLCRAGLQIGVGAGRPDSKESAGIGFGTFLVSAK